MDVNAIVLLIGSIGSLLTTINVVRSAIRKDRRADEKDRRELENWVIEKTKGAMSDLEDRYQTLKQDFENLADDKDKMEHQYLQQIALKEEENRTLRRTNEVLRKENEKYKSKYGVIE